MSDFHNKNLNLIRLLCACFIFSNASLLHADKLSTPTLNPITLRVMSYNIQQMGFPGWFDNHFEHKRLEKLPERILQMESQPDVIVFQETFLPSVHAFITEQLLDVYPYSTQIGGEGCTDQNWSVPATNCDEGSLRYMLTHNSGIFVLSRWPLEESYSLSYENYTASYTFDFMARKGAVYARVNKLGNRFHIVGTHLQADEGSHEVRMAQLDEMKLWLDEFNIEKSEPVILAGDFNVSSLKTSQKGNMLSHSNSWVELAKSRIGSVSTSNNYLSLIHSGVLGSIKDQSLDYILYRVDHLLPKNVAKLEVLNFKSDTPWLAERMISKNVEIFDISDHYPVIIDYHF